MQAIVAKVLSERPTALHTVRDTIPLSIERAVLSALAKLPADRPASAAAFVTMLSESTAQSGVTGQPGDVSRGTLRRWQGLAAALVALVALVALAAASVRMFPELRGAAATTRIVRFSLPAPTFDVNRTSQPAISPDGRTIAYADPGDVNPGIRVRWIDRGAIEILTGTERAKDVAFSPDGSALVYVTADRPFAVHTVGLDGRTKARIGIGFDSRGVAWGRDGYVYLVEITQIVRMPVNGGAPEVVLGLQKENVKATREGALSSLVVLDDAKWLLSATRGAGRTDGNIILVNVDTKTSYVLGRGTAVIGVHDGVLLYSLIDGSVMAQRLDVSQQALVGPAVSVLSDVYQADLFPLMAVGRDGSIVYQAATSTVSRLSWVTRAGAASEVDSTMTRQFGALALSPAGDQIAVSIIESTNDEAIWLYDLTRRTLSRMTPAGQRSFRPSWTPDGSRVLFVSDRGGAGQRRIYSLAPDGGDSARLVVSRVRLVQEISWPAAGGWFGFREGWSDGATNRDIYAMVPGDTAARAVVATNADESNPAVSPDGRWLAYTSDAPGRSEIYVTPFPNGGAKLQVSADGGRSPVWSRDGRELFFRDNKGMLIATTMNTSTANPIGASRALFDASRFYFDANARSFDVSADGRFLFVTPPSRAELNVVLNWWTEAAAILAATTKPGTLP